MTSKDFLNEFAKIVDADPKRLSLDMDLSSVENWDSLAVLTLIALCDEQYGKALKVENLEWCVTIQDIYDIIRQ